MIFIGIVVLIFALDWQLKKHAEQTLEENTVKGIAGNHLWIRKLHNHGVALGMLSDKPNVVLSGTAAVLCMVLISFLKLLNVEGRFVQKLGYACILGGGVNNLADRKIHGYVRDYFSFNVKWKKLRRIVFNVSDMFIFLGTVLMLLGEFCKKNS